MNESDATERPVQIDGDDYNYAFESGHSLQLTCIVHTDFIKQKIDSVCFTYSDENEFTFSHTYFNKKLKNTSTIFRVTRYRGFVQRQNTFSASAKANIFHVENVTYKKVVRVVQ